MPEAFVGREAEQGVLATAWEEARAGQARVVIIEGSAGIGKTRLVQHLVSELRGEALIVAAAGDEDERGLPFGVIHQLVARYPVAVADELARVVTGAGAPPDALAIGAELLGALGQLQETAPVLLVVDDLHWADPLSLSALRFALRRLHADRVLTVVAFRPEATSTIPAGLLQLGHTGSGRWLHLGGLSVKELQALSVAAGTGELSEASARRLYHHTAGNPLYALAVLRELGPDRLVAEGRLPTVPPSLAVLVLARLRACSPRAVRLAQAAAVLGRHGSLDVLAQLADLSDPLPAVEEVIGAGLCRLHDEGRTSLTFSHPLVRAAVYEDLGPVERRALHRRAAELLEGDDRLDHLVRAAVPGDRALAEQLRERATEEAAQGRWPPAARHFLAAARVHPVPVLAADALLRAVMLMLGGSDIAGVHALQGELRDLPPGPRRDYVLGHLALGSGDVAEATTLLESAFAACDPRGDPLVAGACAVWLSQCRLFAGRGLDGAALGRRGLELAPPGSPARGAAWGDVLLGMGMAGRAREALALAPQQGSVTNVEWLGVQFATGVVRLWTDDLEGARRDLSAIERHIGAVGPVSWMGPAFCHLAEAELRAGAWDDALAHADHIATIAADTEDLLGIPLYEAMLASIHGLRGNWVVADDLVRRSTEAARARGDLCTQVYAALAAARVASARNRPADVCTAIAPILALEDPDGVITEPGVLPWQDLYAEALLALGQLDDAERALARLERIAAERRLGSGIAAAARVRGGLEAARGSPDRARDAFERGRVEVERLTMPFLQARLAAELGAFLRRCGRTGRAATELEHACELFRGMGAQPFVERCEAELAACGRRRAPRGSAHLHVTPQERAVARLVAEGLSNRSIAVELVISVKTVEYHLSNLYRKLGVSSRTQLVARLGLAGGAEPGDESSR